LNSLMASVFDAASMVMVKYLVSRLDQYSNSCFKDAPLVGSYTAGRGFRFSVGVVAVCRAWMRLPVWAGCAVTYYLLVLMWVSVGLMDTVAFLKCRGDFGETLGEAVELIGGLGDVGSPLVLKPNICTGDDHTGCANVKVEAVEALVERVLGEAPGTEIRVVESDSMSKFADRAFERYGYRDFVDRLRGRGVDASLVNLSGSPLAGFKLDGGYFKDPMLPAPLADAGGFASVALAKTHSLTMVTGCLKNMFGLLPRKDQSFYHPDIHDVILDLNTLFRSRLCLVDGRTGLEGVISGRPRRLGCVILGRNPVSVDATMARAMGFDPGRIRHIVEAARQGLGSLHPRVVGDDVEGSRVEFKAPSGLSADAVLE